MTGAAGRTTAHPSRLAAIAPRLAAAHAARLVEVRVERRAREKARDEVDRLQWLVAHRDLQLVRAFNVGRAGYIMERQRKLNAAKRLLADALERAEQINALRP